MNGKDTKAIEQIFTKSAFLHFDFEIAIGRCDQSHIDAAGRPTAQTLEFSLLQHAQQHHLQVRPQLADFVQAERSPIGGFKAADAKPVSSREGASFMAEQLRRGECLGNRRQVDRHEVTSGPARAPVNRACQQLLAGPVSPVINTGISVGATRRTRCRTSLRSGECPTMPSIGSGSATPNVEGATADAVVEKL